MNPYIFKRKDEPIAIINLTEDGSIVNYKLNSKYERYICGIKQKRIVALVINLQRVCEIKSVNRHSMISDGAVSS